MNAASEKAVSEISELEWSLAISRAAQDFPRPNWLRKRDDRATEPWIAPQRWRLASAGIQHLSGLIAQLVDLRLEEESDEYGILRADERAFEHACRLLIDAAIEADRTGRSIPRGCASTDEEGGVRVEWARPSASVHLVIPAKLHRVPYIYHRTGDKDDLDPASPERLSHWLRHIDG